MNNGFDQKVIRTLLWILLIGGIAFLVFSARYILLVSLIGVGLATLVSPLLIRLQKQYRLPRPVGALLLIVIFVLLGGGLTFSVGVLVADQVNTLIERGPELLSNLQSMWTRFIKLFPWLREHFAGVDLVQTFRATGVRILSGIRSGVNFFSGMTFALVIAFFTAIRAEEYRRAFISVFSKRYRPKVDSLLLKIAQTLRRWFRAQLIDMAIIGLMTLVGLWIVGIDYWAVFGLLTAVFGLIPYLGTFIVVLVATLVTAASSPHLVVWVLLVFIITQQIEGNIVLPMIMKEQMQLLEVPLLVFMLLMTSWFGLLGVFLATPVFAVARVAYLELYKPVIEPSGDQ